ncbi:helix-turn-helix transcriptional regulator [Variovorax sp. IB41]|uniref:helix-turn-helix transcriptional regulator n=1 Tax=Variovorax sp. IB41 TaxID=2779370 RepID=UPI0018E8241F|nr:hypothetical protein [Variovorax sp. IB41]MBJ2154570.1 hypothetical protein [Variovorax sp. IB41]
MPSTSHSRAALRSCYLRFSANTILHVVYVGIHPDGRIRVTINSDKALVSGNLYSIGEKHHADGSIKKIRHHIHTTKDYQAGGADEVGFLAVGRKTSKPYRIIGCVEYCSPPPSTPPQQLSSRDVVAVTDTEGPAAANDHTTLQQEQHLQSISMGTIAPAEPVLQEAEQQPTATISLACDSPGEAPPSPGVDAGTDVCHNINPEDQVEALRRKKQQQQAERRVKAIHREQAAVTAQRLLGLDPLISVTYLSHISGRSISTLYRAFGKALPKPIKAGGRSRVPYSAAEAYITAR